MILLKDLEERYKADPAVTEQLTSFFKSGYKSYEEEYDKFFNGNYINQVINESSAGQGHIAGAGPIDYNEGKVLYCYIRANNCQYVLECGTAAGCSSVIIAEALRQNINFNNDPILDTVDISTDNYEEGITLFREYVDREFINTKFGQDAIEYINKNHLTKYDLIFIDADHSLDFCTKIAQALFKHYPTTPVFYHEYSLSRLTSDKEKEYVSFTQHIGVCGEREAFETIYPSKFYRKLGFYGSCGLGLIQPKPINVLYRLSSKNAFVSKEKLQYATKMKCLGLVTSYFGKDNVCVQADNCSPEIIEQLKTNNITFNNTNYTSSSEAFIKLLEIIQKLPDDELVYICEDDYLHRSQIKDVLFEGLLLGADYVTGYDHPDKYINAIQGGNPLIEGGGEVTRVLLSNSCHWKYTNSTCLTFACFAKTIKEDFDIWKKAVVEQPSLGSFYAFTELGQDKDRVLISSIPGYSTHTEIKWLSPLRNW